jgi:hypothetical protein
VLKRLPMVSSLALVAAGATHFHQTDAPPLNPLYPLNTPWSGSPGSLVAPTFDPVTEALVPVIAIRLAKLSLAGWAKQVEVKIASDIMTADAVLISQFLSMYFQFSPC